MSLILPFNEQNLSKFVKNWPMFLVWGIVLFFLGLVAISASTFVTLFSVATLGFIIFLSGLVIAGDAFSSWWGHWKGFLMHLLIAALYLFVGFTLIDCPAASSISLTLFLGGFYILAGICRFLFSLLAKTPHWGWSCLNGLISLLLGILILSNWPASGLFIIGLFIGIDLLFCGWTYIMAAITARNYSKSH